MRRLRRLATVPISLHCWQGDDVGGFENPDGTLGGGLAATGNYPGKARTPDELRARRGEGVLADPRHASLQPARLLRRVRRHGASTAMRSVPSISPAGSTGPKSLGIGLDFNPTLFSHPKAADNFTLSHPDQAIRVVLDPPRRRLPPDRRRDGQGARHAVRDQRLDSRRHEGHAGRSRRAARAADRVARRGVRGAARPGATTSTAVEGKLFGIGCESYTVGSHEFYLGYALTRKMLYTLDTGHYHPTETITDKISAVLMFLPEILLHVSRGVRWDSDHVVVLNDDLEAIAPGAGARRLSRPHAHRPRLLRRQHQSRRGVGDRHAQHAEGAAARRCSSRPRTLRACEAAGDYTARLALLEEIKSLPWGAVWDQVLQRRGRPDGPAVAQRSEEVTRPASLRRGPDRSI